MLEPGQHSAACTFGLGEHEVLDVDDGRHAVLWIAEELQADGAHMLGHLVDDPARAGDQPIATLFLDAWQAAEEFVGDILAQPFLAEAAARDVEALGALELAAGGVEITQLEAGGLDLMDLAQVVIQPGDLKPFSLGRDHAPAGQIVERGAPQHSLFAAGIHRHIAADTGRLGRGRVDREHITMQLGQIGNALRDHAGFAPDRRHRLGHTGQAQQFDAAQRFELFSIDDRAVPDQGHGAAGVAGAATPWNDRQAQLDATLHQIGHFGLGVGRQHDKRIFNPPVGCIGDMRDARQTIELDVVARGGLAEQSGAAPAQQRHRVKLLIELADSRARCAEQLADIVIALRVGRRVAAFFDFVQPVLQRGDQLAAALRVVEQVVLQIRIALHHPDVTQHLVEHARRAAGTAFFAQMGQQFPGAGTQQADDDLAIGERGVVVRDLAQTRRIRHRILVLIFKHQWMRCIHGGQLLAIGWESARLQSTRQ